MPFALDCAKGETVIESRDTANRITFKVDKLRHEPKIDHVRERASVRNGTRITVRWPVCVAQNLPRQSRIFYKLRVRRHKARCDRVIQMLVSASPSRSRSRSLCRLLR
jgi:hypothetical protein